ncbi:MAG: DegT/DnrJ/EryC1/StrS family aminotransferase [Pyrinomonadaceae bacterium]
MATLAIHGGEPVTNRGFADFPAYDGSEYEALREVLESGIWGGYNPKVPEFEERFAKFQHARFGISAANGTVTLETALTACGIGSGDEVIVPPISFVATATAVLRVGARPVFADIDADTLNIDPAKVRESVTDRTRALIPVHFAGQPADMDELLSIAEERQLRVIEDCAHAHGASWNGKMAGSLGDFGSFSFQASKNLTAGEGGFLTTNDEELAEAARSICNQGRRTGGEWYEHFRLGTNLRITGWQAAILLCQLSRLPAQLETRAQSAELLNERLSEMKSISIPVVDERVTGHSFYLYPIRLGTELLECTTKNTFVNALNAEGIPCSAGYPHPLYKNPVFHQLVDPSTECPEAEQMCRDTFWFSHEVMLAGSECIDDVVSAIEKVLSAIRGGQLT